MKNYVQEGEYLEIVAPYDRTAGQGVLVGKLFGVCVDDVLSGGAVTIDTGDVFDLTKSVGAGTGGAQGARAYWDDTAKAITAVATSNTLVGAFAVTAADADAVARVRLNGVVL
jgi:predicted RecA/RadA family phage recombinase